MARFLPPHPVIVDAGAHIGTDTIEMAKRWPAARVHSFEPIPSVFERLKTDTSRFPNVTCYQMALSDHSGESTMFVSGGTSDGSSSLLPPKEHLNTHPEVTFEEQIKVKVLTLDDWAKEYGIERVDALWLDLQGAEHQVMMASPRIMSSVKAIHLEVSLNEQYSGGSLYPIVKAWLEEQGFEIMTEALAWEDGGNVLAARR